MVDCNHIFIKSKTDIRNIKTPFFGIEFQGIEILHPIESNVPEETIHTFDTSWLFYFKTLGKTLELLRNGIGINHGDDFFHSIWESSGQTLTDPEDRIHSRAHGLLAKLTANTREALLLRTIEDFNISQVAVIMQTGTQAVRALIATANDELAKSTSGRVMIIEDEPIIAADIAAMVTSLGHEVTGIARTHTEAVALGKDNTPDLILADIQLADNSSGIDAVNDLLDVMDVPVIFITAFPERLLTGDRPEPAFLISKPFQEAQVLSAVSQAMFFSSTETLKV